MEEHVVERLRKKYVWKLVDECWKRTPVPAERIDALCARHTDLFCKLRKALRSAKRWGGHLSLAGHRVTCEEDIPGIFGIALNGDVWNATLFITRFEHELDLQNSALRKKNGRLPWKGKWRPF